MKTPLFISKLVSGMFAVMLMFSASMPVLAATINTKTDWYQTIPKVNVRLKVNKVSYFQRDGFTYAYVTGTAIDPDSIDTPVKMMHYYYAKDNTNYITTDNLTENEGKFGWFFMVKGKGKILICAHDDQAGSYKCAPEITIKTQK